MQRLSIEKESPFFVILRVLRGLGTLAPPTGFEPVISTLKGWRPWPLDDGGATPPLYQRFPRGQTQAHASERRAGLRP